MTIASASPFRTMTLACPRCHNGELTAGPLHHCPACRGTWIEEATLREHVGSMRAEPPVPPPPPLEWSVATDRAGLACAACRQPMEPLLLFAVPVDRCMRHGVWFDEQELSLVLERSARPIGSMLADGTAVVGTDLGLSAGAEIALTALEAVVEVGSGLGEAILEILGGIFSAIDL